MQILLAPIFLCNMVFHFYTMTVLLCISQLQSWEKSYTVVIMTAYSMCITVVAMEVLIKCCMNSFSQVDKFI